MDEATLMMEVEGSMEIIIDRLNEDFDGLRTGKASPGLVENMEINVISYGSTMKLKSMAVVSTPDARSILIQPFDPSTLNDIKRSIESSRLNLTPIIDARSVRLPIPELSGERRVEMCKYAKTLAEETRVRLRSARKTGMGAIKKLKADNILTEDGVVGAEEKVQKLTDKYVKEVSTLLEAKEKDIATV